MRWVRITSEDGFTFIVERRAAIASPLLAASLNEDSNFAESLSNTCGIPHRPVSYSTFGLLRDSLVLQRNHCSEGCGISFIQSTISECELKWGNPRLLGAYCTWSYSWVVSARLMWTGSGTNLMSDWWRQIISRVSTPPLPVTPYWLLLSLNHAVTDLNPSPIRRVALSRPFTSLSIS